MEKTMEKRELDLSGFIDGLMLREGQSRGIFTEIAKISVRIARGVTSEHNFFTHLEKVVQSVEWSEMDHWQKGYNEGRVDQAREQAEG